MGSSTTGGLGVFGPVPSRRLGLSLGVDLVQPKTCSLNCVYCELGPTTRLTTQRRHWRPVPEVLAQVSRRLAELAAPPDFITLAGSGEPTLHLGLEEIIRQLKETGPARLAVLSNATLTPLDEVRRALSLADVVIPSLDAASQPIFQRINRPAPGLRIEEIIEGMAALRRQMSGQMWLEVLLARGYNDSEEELAAIIKAARRIGPHKVQLNTVIRPPALKGVEPLDQARLDQIAGRFEMPVEVIAPPRARAQKPAGELAGQVVEMTRRRPCTIADVANMAGLGMEQARGLVEDLAAQGRLQRETFGETTFYRGV